MHAMEKPEQQLGKTVLPSSLSMFLTVLQCLLALLLICYSGKLHVTELTNETSLTAVSRN